MAHSPSTRIALTLVAATLAVATNTVPVAAIEPDVVYETVLEGYTLAHGRRIVAGDDGSAYLTADFQGHRNDILVAKLEPGGAVVWETTVHGSSIDIATALVLDDAGNVVIAGWTDSADFPTTADALHPSRVAHRDAFLLKLSTADGTLVYGTYLGGDHSDQAEALAIASDGTIYLAGSTDSTDYPTVNALQGSLANPPYQFSDAFITRLSADGTTILYSTYFGAGRDDAAVGIGLAGDGKIVVAGVTGSTDFPVQGGVQASFAGGQEDAFVTVLSADGSEILASTYLGGENWDRLQSFDLGADGSAYLTGFTASVAFPTTADTVQPFFAGEILGCEIPFSADRNCYDAFLVRLSPDLDQMVYGTYLGGDRDDEARDLAVASGGSARVVGYTFSADFPATSGPVGPAIFAAQVDAAGKRLDYAITIDAAGSPNAGHGIAVGPADATTYLTAARNVPADVLVTRFTGGLLFADGLETGDTSAWSQ